jgi:hypothetical protein
MWNLLFVSCSSLPWLNIFSDVLSLVSSIHGYGFHDRAMTFKAVDTL